MRSSMYSLESTKSNLFLIARFKFYLLIYGFFISRLYDFAPTDQLYVMALVQYLLLSLDSQPINLRTRISTFVILSVL